MSSKPSPDVKAREAQILGQPARIGPLKPEEFTDEARQMVRDLRKAVGLPPSDIVPDFVATMLRHPKLHQRHTDLALAVMNGCIPHRDRELAILRNAWLCQAPYEWTEHVKVGKRLGGLTSEEIERVTQGSDAPGWSDHDRAILRAVEELHTNAMISDGTWAVLARTFDDKQLLELPLLIGQYVGVAYLQNSIRTRLMDDGIGLTAR